MVAPVRERRAPLDTGTVLGVFLWVWDLVSTRIRYSSSRSLRARGTRLAAITAADASHAKADLGPVVVYCFHAQPRFVVEGLLGRAPRLQALQREGRLRWVGRQHTPWKRGAASWAWTSPGCPAGYVKAKCCLSRDPADRKAVAEGVQLAPACSGFGRPLSWR